MPTSRRRPDLRLLLARTLASRCGALLAVVAAQLAAPVVADGAGLSAPVPLGLVGPALLVGLSATWAWWDATDAGSAAAVRCWTAVAAVVGGAALAGAALEARWQVSGAWVPSWSVGIVAAALVVLPAGLAVLAHRLLVPPARAW